MTTPRPEGLHRPPVGSSAPAPSFATSRQVILPVIRCGAAYYPHRDGGAKPADGGGSSASTSCLALPSTVLFNGCKLEQQGCGGNRMGRGFQHPVDGCLVDQGRESPTRVRRLAPLSEMTSGQSREM